MTSRFAFRGQSEGEIRLRFGGGIHTRASENEINPREAADGQNLLLDLANLNYRNRPPFDLVGTAPNAEEIRGFITYKNSSNAVKFLVQAGDTVYDWDGSTNFTFVASVNGNAKLRGRKEHNWLLDDKVLVTDMNLQQPVMEYDGTTLVNVSFTGVSGSFLARYCFVAAERAWFAHVNSNGVLTSHLVVGSERGDFTTLSTANRPSSSLNAQDPFFLLTPDLRPINGMVQAWTSTEGGAGQNQRVVLSSQDGVLSKIIGTGADNFEISEFYSESGANGAESMRFIGNDIAYGRQGRIESVAATERFGDVSTVDLSKEIQEELSGLEDWTTIYNSRLQRVYFFSADRGVVYVLFKELIGSEVSPWARWATQHPLSFQPSAVLNMFDPLDGLEYTFMGDASGNIYRLEGSGASGDGGSANIQTEFLSAYFDAPKQTQIYGVQGYIQYRAGQANTVRLRFEYAGESVFNEEVPVNLPAVDAQSGSEFWGGNAFWGGDFYWNVAFSGRLTRKKFAPPGQANALQLRVIVEGTNDIEINEIGLNFEAAR